MSWKDKLNKYVEAKREQLQRGVNVTEQMKAERLRKLEPGTIRYGLAHKQSVKNFMKDAYIRRKSLRKKGKE
jgi:hypothetical protein